MRLLNVTHGPLVGPELFADVASEDGHELVDWDARRGGAPTDRFDAVLIFGGAQNVGEEDQHPWLAEEYEVIGRWLDDAVPLFGICLGAQTIAHAAGARVAPAVSRRAGFYSTELTDAGMSDPVLGVLPPRFDALNANGYAFDVPPGAVELARNDELSQAYRLGERAWGVQFHPEARRDQVLRWFQDDRVLPRPLDEITAELDDGIVRWHALGRRLARAFFQVAGAG